ncbi:MAG: hypothetical protein EOO09_06260 [Chitinophagaceae bacterium]|nr:MAG: hypothetical protein EOO09_06260 [Chitinophagaceae bacterium]
MKKWLFIFIMVVFASGFGLLSERLNDPAMVRSAISKSLPLLEASSHTFLFNADPCHSCHGQGLGLVAFSLAREKGFAVADSTFDEAIGSIRKTWKRRTAMLGQNEDPAALAIGGGYDLWAFSSANTKAEKRIVQLARNLMSRQLESGNWVSPNGRPPSEYYSFSATAMAVKALRAYLPESYNTELSVRLDRAIHWMETTTPLASEEKSFQLLGLHWAGADTNFITTQGRALLLDQRSNGGWSQLPQLPTDAYATGQALYALAVSGTIPTTDIAYQRGISYLLQTQFSDGSWYVKTRSFPSVPFADSGFPHGDSQFISAAGTNWATLALLLSLESPKKPAVR